MASGTPEDRSGHGGNLMAKKGLPESQLGYVAHSGSFERLGTPSQQPLASGFGGPANLRGVLAEPAAPLERAAQPGQRALQNLPTLRPPPSPPRRKGRPHVPESHGSLPA